MFTGLTLLCWIVGLAVLYAAYKVAVLLDEIRHVDDDVDAMELFARDRGAR
jgi:hypothetical protein